MSILEIIRFTIGSLFLIAGLIVFVIEIIGIFKLDYVLLRIHAAAMGDTMGLFLCLIGVCFYSGFNFTTAKLILVIILFWISSPVASHMTALLESYTNNRLYKHLSFEGDLDVLEKKMQKEREQSNDSI